MRTEAQKRTDRRIRACECALLIGDCLRTGEYRTAWEACTALRDILEQIRAYTPHAKITLPAIEVPLNLPGYLINALRSAGLLA